MSTPEDAIQALVDGVADGLSGVQDEQGLQALANTSSPTPPESPTKQHQPPPEQPQEDQLTDRPEISPFEVQPAGTPEAIPETPDESDDVSFGEAVEAAVQQQWIIGPDELEHNTTRYTHDPDFQWSPEFVDEITKDIPEPLWDAFDDAGSAEHAKAIRQEVLSDLENQRVLDDVSGGWAYQLGAAVVDPTAVGITVGTSGAGAAAVAGTKLTKLQRFISMLGVNVSTDMAIESAVIANDSTQSWDNLLYAGVASAGLNSAIIARQLRKGGDAARLNDEMAKAYQDHAAKMQTGEAYEELAGSAGAARASVPEPISEAAEDALNEFSDAPVTSYGAARLDVVGKLKSSDHPIFRELGDRLAEDALGNVDNSVNRFGASEYQNQLFRTMDTQVQRGVTPAYREWAKERGISPFGRWFFKEREVFMREVYDYVTQEGTESAMGRQWHSSVARAGDAYRSAYTQYLSKLKEAKVKGFEDIDINPNYMPRFFDHERIADLNRAFGSAELRKLIAGAFRGANSNVTKDQAEKFAKVYLTRIREVGANVDMGLTRGLTGEDGEALQTMLRDATDLDPADVDAMVNSLKISREGGHSRSKRRALFDDSFSTVLKRVDSTGEQRIGINELFNRNAEHVFDLYNRQVSGAVALGRVGFNSPAQVESMINKARATAGDIKGYTKVDRDADLATFLLDSVTGRPTSIEGGQDARFTAWGRRLTMLRDYNFLRLMGNLGLAQIPEAGRVLGELGWRNAIKALPAMRGMVRNMQTGKLSNELLDEFEGIIGTGSEYLTSTIYNRVGIRLEGDDFAAQGISQSVGRGEVAMAHAKRVMTAVSGMQPVNTFLYRWTSATMANRWVNLANGTQTISPKRLAWMGLTEDMHASILDQIRKHGDFDVSPMTGQTKKVRRLNIDQWTDKDAAEAFTMASHRLSRNVIQANDPGTLPKWVTSSPLMQTVWQFRSFMWGSWSKQTLHGIKMRDFPAVSAFMAAVVLGGMTHSFRVYMMSQGMGDKRKDEYLDKQLSPEGIAAGAFLRAGQSSIIPMVYDTFVSATGQGPFAGARGSGLASSVLGNPTIDLVNNAPREVIDGVSSGATEKATARALSLLPYQNTIGIQQGLNALAKELGN